MKDEIILAKKCYLCKSITYYIYHSKLKAYEEIIYSHDTPHPHVSGWSECGKGAG